MEVDLSDKSRQKSCNACVRSKRRCDKRTPKCTRCAEKNFSCIYQNLPNGSSDDEPHQMDVQSMELPAGFDHDFELESEQTPLSTLSDSFAMVADASEPLDIGFDFNSMFSFLAADQNQNNGMQLWQTPDAVEVQAKMNPPSLCSQSKDVTLTLADYASINGACEGFQPWEVHEPHSKIGHFVGQIKEFHVTFAKDKETPFMHRYVYRHNMPRTMLQAYTTITAYANRTDANKDWAIRVLCENVSDLTRSTAVTPYEKLARVHALLLYQAIRCFDGDVSLRALAENDMPTFAAWVADLEKYRDNLDDVWTLDEISIRQRQPKSWERWIFTESVRRTILISYAFMTMYDLLKTSGGNSESLGPWERPHRWTASKHLWAAESSFEFFSAWREKSQFMIQNFSVENLVKFGRPDDLDEFSCLLLTPHLGVEETKRFATEGIA